MWQAWNTLRTELLYVVWALMEIALIVPVVLTVMNWARYWPPGQTAAWLLLLMLLPFNLARLLSLLGVSKQNQQTVLAVSLLLIVAYTALRTQIPFGFSLVGVLLQQPDQRRE